MILGICKGNNIHEIVTFSQANNFTVADVSLCLKDGLENFEVEQPVVVCSVNVNPNVPQASLFSYLQRLLNESNIADLGIVNEKTIYFVGSFNFCFTF